MRLEFLSFLGFLLGFFFSRPQARIPYFPVPLANPSPCSHTSCVRSSAGLPGGGEPAVTVRPGHPNGNLRPPPPHPGVGYTDSFSAGPINIRILCLLFLLSCSFWLCLMLMWIMLYNHYVFFFLLSLLL